MAGPAPGERARAGEQARVRLRDVAVPLGVLLALGLVLRLIIAYAVLPGSGFKVDVGSFNGWAVELARNGPFGIYDRGIFIDYTPGYLYVLWGLGLVAQLLGGPGAAPGDLLKLPAILADLGLAVAVFQLAADLGARRRAALGAAALVLFVPVTWFDSSIWSQVDSVGTLVLLLAVRDLWRGRDERAALLTTVAAIIKPQFGILIPLAAVLILRRNLVTRPPGHGPRRVVTTTLVGLVTAQLVCLPFGLTIVGLLHQIVDTAAGYPWLTVNAFNPWALVSQAGAGLALNGTWIRDATQAGADGGTGFLVLGIPAVVVGSALLLGMIGLLAAVIWRRDDRRTFLVALTVLAIAFFVLPTRVHERYLFPFFALGAVLVAVSPRWIGVYLALAVANTANLYGILTEPFYANLGLGPMLDAFSGLGSQLGDAARSWGGVAAAAAVHAGGLLTGLAFLVRPASEEVDATTALAATEEDSDGAAPAEEMHAPLGARGDATVVGGPGEAHVARGVRHRSGARTGDRRRTRPRRAGTLRSLTPSRWGGRRQARPAGPVVHRRDRRRVALPANLPARASRCGCTSTRSTTRARPPSSCRTGATASRTRSTSGPTRPWPSTSWRAGSSRSGTTGSPPRARSARRLRTSRSRRAGPTRQPPAGGRSRAATGSTSPRAPASASTTCRRASSSPRWHSPVRRRSRSTPRGTGSSPARLRARSSPSTRPSAAAALRVEVSGGLSPPALVPLGSAGGPVTRLWVTDGGATVLAATPGDTLVSLDAATGVRLASVTLAGRSEVADAGTVNALVADPASVSDPTFVAAQLSRILGGTAATYEQQLRSKASQVVISTAISAQRTQIDAAIASGALAGLSDTSLSQVAVADAAGVTFVEPTSGAVTGQVPLAGGATSVVAAPGLDSPVLYAATDSSLAVIGLPADGSTPTLSQSVWMPAAISRVTYDAASQMIHALGRTTDGTGWTVYVVEPRGNSVFEDARLPFAPAAWATDANPDIPATDREQLLVFAATGQAASVDIGQHAFAWRLPGVIVGALMAGLLFLLARILFRRRSVAVLAGVFGLLDGMFFVQQRIGMNDTYVAFFIVAGVTLFAAIWTGAWRWRGAFWVGMPVVGLLLGLATASKWVGLYALAAVALLILVRSALGRVVVILGLAGATAVLGYMAVSVPAGATSGGDLTFLALMIGLTLVAAAVTVLHPIAWSVEEVWIAVAGPAAVGALVALVAIPLALGSAALALALGCFGVSALAAGGFWFAGRLGFGPLAPPLAPDDPVALIDPPAPAPEGWLRPGWRRGLPVAWAGISLGAIPTAVYVAIYLPWVALGNRLTSSWPPGNTGQTLLDLTKQMYDYHNNLRAAHPAASPWWAWPLDLKPVWFFQQSFGGSTSGAIYDGGNPVIWWLSIAAMAFVAWQAYRRRSLGLGLISVVIAFTWLSWARIDRATFEYHYYATLPFVILALAYFVAELWHGPSARTWLLARGTAAAALLIPGGPLVRQGPAVRPRPRRTGRPRLAGVHCRRIPALLADGPGGGPHHRPCGRRGAPGLAAGQARPDGPGGRGPGRRRSGLTPDHGDRARRPRLPGRGGHPAPGDAAGADPEHPGGASVAAPPADPGAARLARVDGPLAAPVRRRRRARLRRGVRRLRTRTGRGCRSRTASSTGTRACSRRGSTRSSSP